MKIFKVCFNCVPAFVLSLLNDRICSLKNTTFTFTSTNSESWEKCQAFCLILLASEAFNEDLRLNMEQYKEKKYECKYCSKMFVCGKSLGGHIRTHMNEEAESNSDELKIDENGGQSSYSLRENPKKNKRFVDHRQIMALKQQQQKLLLYCRECGKGFVSSKALCGHMACHSERVMDSQSDTEASLSPLRRRSKRALKHHHHHKASFVVCGVINQSNSVSSDASEIEPEQEDMALSLIMLSRDCNFKKGHNSLVESSDNNSVILETKSSSGEQVKNVEDFCKKKNGDGLSDSDNSDSDYFMNGPKSANSDVSVDGFLRNKAVMESESGFNSSLTQQDKNLDRFKKQRYKGGSKCMKKIKYKFTESVYDSGEHSLETESCADTNRTIKIHSKKVSAAKKKSKGHVCPICSRVFKSGQALGGHKRSHFIGNQGHRTLVLQHNVVHEMHTLIDLNLPAPVDE